MPKLKGFIDKIYLKDREKRLIHIPKQPPLKVNRFYKGRNPILRAAWVKQSDIPDKVILLEEIKFENRKELRMRYYIIGRKPRMRGKWTYGESAPLIPKSDLLALIDIAKKEGLL